MIDKEIKPVAIIITTYNAGKYFELAIDSLLESTKYPLKLIIIESASTDGTAEKCDEYAKNDKRINVIHSKEREGVTKAVNKGIKEAGDLDVFLTHCDVIFPKKYLKDWLEEMVITSKKYKDCGLVTCYGGYNISDASYLSGLKYVGTWSMFLPRTTINKVGLFDEEFLGPGDDIDYTYRVNISGLKTYVIDYWTNHHRLLEHHNNDDEVNNIKVTTLIKNNGNLFKKKWGFDKISKLTNLKCNNNIKTFNSDSLLDSGYTKEELNFIHHDKEVFDMITKVVNTFNENDIYIDVGAGIGDTSIWTEKGTCFAFEPGRNYKHLLTNINLNPICHVIPIKKAVYSKQINYETIEKEHFGLDEIKETTDILKSKTITLDSFFSDNSNIKLIKIDVEHSSLEVLKGSIEIIKKNRPVIIIEIIHCDEEIVKKILQDLNYNIIISKDNITCIGIPKELMK